MIVPGDAVKESLLEEVGPNWVVREYGIFCEKINKEKHSRREWEK